MGRPSPDRRKEHGLTPAALKNIGLPASGGEDKNSRGKVLIVGSSRRVPGAVLLTAEAALRVGAGKVRLAVPAGLAPAIGAAFPEAAVLALSERSHRRWTEKDFGDVSSIGVVV